MTYEPVGMVTGYVAPSGNAYLFIVVGDTTVASDPGGPPDIVTPSTVVGVPGAGLPATL